MSGRGHILSGRRAASRTIISGITGTSGVYKATSSTVESGRAHVTISHISRTLNRVEGGSGAGCGTGRSLGSVVSSGGDVGSGGGASGGAEVSGRARSTGTN